MGRPNLFLEIKLARREQEHRGIFIFSVQLTTSRISNLTRLIHTLAICVTIHTYIHRCSLYKIPAVVGDIGYLMKRRTEFHGELATDLDRGT